MPAETARSLQHATTWLELARQLFSIIDRHRAEVTFTVGAEAADVRRVTLQVVDRLGRPWKAKWLIEVFIAQTDGGNPGGTQTLTVATGFLAQAVIADTMLRVITDADGVAAIDVTVTGAANRWVYARVVDKFQGSGQHSWAA